MSRARKPSLMFVNKNGRSSSYQHTSVGASQHVRPSVTFGIAARFLETKHGSACGPVIVPVFKTGERQAILSLVGSTPTRFRHFSMTCRHANQQISWSLTGLLNHRHCPAEAGWRGLALPSFICCLVARNFLRVRPGAQSLTNDAAGPIQLIANQLQAWRADARISNAQLNLDQLDELNEVGHGIHAQERQEPAV